jgi:hypothetical protein
VIRRTTPVSRKTFSTLQRECQGRRTTEGDRVYNGYITNSYFQFQELSLDPCNGFIRVGSPCSISTPKRRQTQALKRCGSVTNPTAHLRYHRMVCMCKTKRTVGRTVWRRVFFKTPHYKLNPNSHKEYKVKAKIRVSLCIPQKLMERQKDSHIHF